jgi:nucleotide-binding universal stress UspA family protein
LVVDVSPFPFHGPLQPEELSGRDGIVSTLVERLTVHRPTVLVAPRRYGKTSVLGRVASELADTITVIRVDLYELRSWADLAVRLDDALAAVGGSGRSALDRVAASMQFDLGLVKVNFARPDRPEPDITTDRLLDVIVEHAQRTPSVLIFDEFSSIVRVNGAAGLLRTKLQHHFTTIGLLFAGSEPSTMHMLFAETDQPFYAQADLVELPGLDFDTVADLVENGFDPPAPGDLASRLDTFARGHPQRTMQLADAAWQAQRGGVEPDDLWDATLEGVRRSTDAANELRFAGMSTSEQAVMRLAANRRPLHGRDAELLALGSTSATAARRTLLGAGHIATTESKRVEMIDPLFADWIRRRFPL